MVRSRRSANHLSSALHVHPTLEAREFQISVRMMFLVYAFVLCVKQSPQFAKTRARHILSGLVAAVVPRGCAVSLPICVSDQWQNVSLLLEGDRIVNPPHIWYQYLQQELGLDMHVGLSNVFTKLAESGAIMHRPTGCGHIIRTLIV